MDDLNNPADAVTNDEPPEETMKPTDRPAQRAEPAEAAGLTGTASTEAEHAPEVRSLNLGQLTRDGSSFERSSLDLILDVELEATVELGRARLAIRDILGLGPGSVVELDKLAGEPADLLINGRRLARGEIVVIDDDFGIRITEILTPTERLNSLR